MLGLDEDQTESVSTTLGSTTKFEGTVDTDESLRIDGLYEGTINCNGTLVIGSDAEVKAEIEAGSAIIGGHVNGDVTADERIEIQNNGEIFGDLTAPILHIERGVTLEGNCTINTGGTGGDESDQEKVTSIEEKLG